MTFNWKKTAYHPSPLLRAVQIILLVFIIIGIVLIATQKLWVPKVVEYILEREGLTLEEPIKEVETEEPSEDTMSVRIGETVTINGVRVALLGVVSDSRCPADVTCIWAGLASFEVTLKSNTDEETLELSTDGPPHAFGSFLISILEVAPTPVSTKPLTPSDYVVTFNVTSL